MADQSFLSQLEQRTQQVKITLANLEAEKIRIENAINQLQPLVPQYDALIAAERAIADSNVVLEDVAESQTAVPQTYAWQPAGEESRPASSW